MDNMREEFEAWWGSEGHSGFVINGKGNYVFSHTQTAWLSWKASRAALCVELPSKINDRNDSFSCGFDSAISSAEVSLENAGVQYK